MDQKLRAAKTGLTAALTALTAFLGWKGMMLLAWVGVMALDYISGTLAACRQGQWSSEAARQGLWHKGGMIFVVMVAGLCDMVMVMMMTYLPLEFQWPGLILPLVVTWYLITELGSILENAVKMGSEVPQWLVKLLKAGREMTESAGDAAAGTLISQKEKS